MHRGVFSALEDVINAFGGHHQCTWGISSLHLGDIVNAFGRYQDCCGTPPMH